MANVELVHNLTASSAGDPEAARFVLNKFADLTPAEFQQTYRSGYKPVDVAPNFVEPTKFRLPTKETKVDWRTRHAVTKIYDQGTCGCCWAVSTIQAIESQWFIQKRGPLPSLSFQQLICCDCRTTHDKGCHGGDPLVAYEYIVAQGGVESSDDYPFTDQDSKNPMPWETKCNTDAHSSEATRCKLCKFKAEKVVANITGYVNVSNHHIAAPNETALADAVATVGPVSVCLNSGPMQTYGSGILDKCADTTDHCVLVVGYDAEYATPYWIVKNSWGDDWGEEGYIRIKMGGNVCGIADMATYPLL